MGSLDVIFDYMTSIRVVLDIMEILKHMHFKMNRGLSNLKHITSISIIIEHGVRSGLQAFF